MGVDRFLAEVKAGKAGRNIGISTGMAKLDKIIYGIQRKYLYTIGADLSGGKTSFALDVFVYNLLKNAGSTPISILYYSFEMSESALYAKLLSLYIWDHYKEIITFSDTLSLVTKITDEQERLVELASEWLRGIAKNLIIYDKALTPNGIYATCKEWLKNFGTFTQISEHKEEYVEYDPNRYKVVLIDHVGLIGGSDTKKAKIDTVVEYFIYFRNKCNMTGIFIQQMNRNAKGMDRKLNGYELFQLDDFKDTSGTTEGSEVVIALYFPYREKIARCEGYPIQNVLKKRFRLCQILKNRYGQADVNIGMAFYGEIGLYKDLPKPEEITDYEPYLNLVIIKDMIESKETMKEDEKEENNIFKL
jgi:hypothetical protein